MLDYALGEIGLLPDQFWHPDFTWNDYDRVARGYQLRQVREWERTRWTAEHMAAFLGVDLTAALAKEGRKRLLDLPTDTDEPTTAGKHTESEADFWARMTRNNYFRPTHGNA